MSTTSPAQTTRLLPRAAPADAGISAAGIGDFLDAVEDRGIELHSLMVVHGGAVAAEGWWAPYAPERPHLLYSLSKSFTSTAAGFAIAEGLFSLDDRVVDLLPAHVPDDVDPAVASLTVHHVLSMSTGHTADTLGTAYDLEPGDLVRGFLRQPPQDQVGSRHVYNNSCTYVVATLVQELGGTHLTDYLRPRLFEPLGITPGHWDDDGHGRAIGFSGLHLTTEAIAAFGQLLLADGRWNGEQVLPEGWVARATRSHVRTDSDPATNVDWAQGYGYQFWMGRHGFRGDGAYGQFCVVVPESDLVLATTSVTDDMQGILDAAWDHLLPAVGTADADPAAGDRLAERLASLALPVVGADPGAAPTAPMGPVSPVTFVVPDGEGPGPLPAGTRVQVAPADDGWQASFTFDGGTVRIDGAPSVWVETEVTAAVGHDRNPTRGRSREATTVLARGGWRADGTFEADVLLAEMPHRFRLRGAGGVATAAWNAVPLAGERFEAHLP
ncbi:class C beta-lactamase-related serine hydrolase [Occultella glacieicola]|uniref:Class C beta-lactamase-related serine hydrolase n=1 Tax=Occultella glacieicola TaxID=2518684 RepID=A0ABY2E3C5_9MICO|nr:serine hydrolase [Occultella glacieicola]TDE92704.1 class C beta-lactamase-related serine hydrolase [Occultella glacieicola]